MGNHGNFVVNTVFAGVSHGHVVRAAGKMSQRLVSMPEDFVKEVEKLVNLPTQQDFNITPNNRSLCPENEVSHVTI